MKDWEPPKTKTELKYKKALEKILKSIAKLFQDSSDPFEIVKALKAIANTSEFKNYCQSAARSVVTMLKVENAQSWRAAAQKSSKGQIIYQALKNEVNNPVISSTFYNQINKNAELISSLPLDMARHATNYISKETLKGRRAEDIAEDLKNKYPQLSSYRAGLIARTEVSKINTALTQARCENLNINWYIWRTSEDGRVRSAHRHMNGVLIKWGNPPNPEALAGEEKNHGNYDAGNIFNCRCYAEPLINLDQISWPHKVYYNGNIQMMTRKQFEELNSLSSSSIEYKPDKKPEKKKLSEVKLPEFKPKKENNKISFIPAKSVKEAEKWAVQNIARNVSFKGLHLESANQLNQAIYETIARYPKLKGKFEFIGESHERNNYFKPILLEKEVSRLKELNPNIPVQRLKDYAQRTVKSVMRRLAVSSRAFAESCSLEEINGITLNRDFAKNPVKFKEVLKCNTQSKFHPVGCDTIKSVIDHEIGHQLDTLLGVSNNDIIKGLYYSYKNDLDQLTNDLSRYAWDNRNRNPIREFVAEAYSEFMNNPNPRKIAKIVGELIDELHNKQS